ncbi:MAG: LON peptidase substrate-binding domain-containing protein [Planctomycetaceae bacterium]|nr:LON peptidase substrate-binding domain-containing protein [Planctomycetaceae bacterium]
MMTPFDVATCLKQFTGYAPLFPLPNGVLFPQLVLPLHVFEERYRDMTAAALAGDRLIAMALLRPSSEAVYQTKAAAIYPVVSLGQIVMHERLDDGRYNIVLRGVCRARVHEEPVTDHLYRIGRLEPLQDVYPEQSAKYWDGCRRSLLEAFRRRFPQLQGCAELQHSVAEDLSLGVLCDLLCSSLPLTPLESAELLMETDVRRRCAWVLQRLAAPSPTSPGAATFPPEFSVN